MNHTLANPNRNKFLARFTTFQHVEDTKLDFQFHKSTACFKSRRLMGQRRPRSCQNRDRDLQTEFENLFFEIRRPCFQSNFWHSGSETLRPAFSFPPRKWTSNRLAEPLSLCKFWFARFSPQLSNKNHHLVASELALQSHQLKCKVKRRRSFPDAICPEEGGKKRQKLCGKWGKEQNNIKH